MAETSRKKLFSKRPEFEADGMIAAIREAVIEACLWHKRIGNPIAVWKNGEVVWIQPEDINPPASKK